MSKWSIFALCIIAAVGLWFYNNGACPLQAMSPSSDTASSGSYQQITASQVKERLDKGDKITVIDVRTPDEYAAGHIPGSLLIPFDEIKVKSDQFFAGGAAGDAVLLCNRLRRRLIIIRNGNHARFGNRVHQACDMLSADRTAADDTDFDFFAHVRVLLPVSWETE